MAQSHRIQFNHAIQKFLRPRWRYKFIDFTKNTSEIVNPEPLYSNNVKISAEKYRDLLSLLDFIPQNYISELLITSDTMLWMAGENNLTTLDGQNYQYQKINASKESAVYNKNRTPGSLVQDDDGNIWNITYQKNDRLLNNLCSQQCASTLVTRTEM